MCPSVAGELNKTAVFGQTTISDQTDWVLSISIVILIFVSFSLSSFGSTQKREDRLEPVGPLLKMEERQMWTKLDQVGVSGLFGKSHFLVRMWNRQQIYFSKDTQIWCDREQSRPRDSMVGNSFTVSLLILHFPFFSRFILYIWGILQLNYYLLNCLKQKYSISETFYSPLI